jgi:hydrogenase large subunit
MRMSFDIGLDKYGRGPGKFVSWGYLPHEDKYNKPTIEGRNSALIMKSGVFDGAAGTFKTMDQINTREDTLHAWYDEGGEVHPFNRTTNPIPKNDIDTKGKYSWSTAVRHIENGRLEAGPLARQLIAGGDHGEDWQHKDPLVLDMYRKLGGASIFLRHFARMHELCKLYREAERILREFRLNDEWYIKPTERDGQGWGATEAIRGALCHWIDVRDGKIFNYQIIAPTTWNVGPRDGAQVRAMIFEAAGERVGLGIGHVDWSLSAGSSR